MRQGRLKVPTSHPVGYYHCISRVVDRQFIFTDLEKERFVSLMREVEDFCEVRALTFNVMSNHFHLLLEVPKRPEILPTAEALIAKLKGLSKPPKIKHIEQQIQRFRRHNDLEGEACFLEGYWRRMWDLSQFMKELKQRYTQGYNQRYGRKGTLWEERFKSVVVEGNHLALIWTGVYIDLNSLRAWIVGDPKDYRWSGYGMAVAGDKRAQEGIQKIVDSWEGAKGNSLERSMEVYRMQLFQTGDEQREALDEAGKPLRGVLKHDEVLTVLKNKGKLNLRDYVKCRVRYFCDGAILGSRMFVGDLLQANYERMGVIKQKPEPQRVEGLVEDLYSLRRLRDPVFG